MTVAEHLVKHHGCKRKEKGIFIPFTRIGEIFSEIRCEQREACLRDIQTLPQYQVLPWGKKKQYIQAVKEARVRPRRTHHDQ